MKRPAIFILLSVLFAVLSPFNVKGNELRTGNALVTQGESYLGRDDTWPLAKPADILDEYGNWVWEQDDGQWADGFDCSGFVGYSMNVRRHYSINNGQWMSFLEPVSWENAEVGSIITNYGHTYPDESAHIMILAGKFESDGKAKIKLLHSSYSAHKVAEVEELDPAYPDAKWITLGLEGDQDRYSPYKVKDDNKGPVITVNGVENGGEYSNPRTITISVKDNVEPPYHFVYAYVHLIGPDGLDWETGGTDKKGAVKKTKTVSKPGQYNLLVKSIDWARNVSKTEITFEIKDECRPDNMPRCCQDCCPSEEATCNISGEWECTPSTSPDFSCDPPGDQQPPDDNNIVADYEDLVVPNFDPNAKVGVLTSGFYRQAIAFLDQLDVSIVLIDREAMYQNFTPDLAERVPVIIIPSSGLTNHYSSEVFRRNLEEYTANGGNLIVFSQPQAEDWSALPGEIDAIGYSQDISCFRSGARLNLKHPLLSSEAAAYSDVHMDGFFVNYPPHALELLIRQANSQPAVILYPYGAGTVIATDMYPDYAYWTGQYSMDELHYVRDMITWALQPSDLREYSPGDLDPDFTFTLELPTDAPSDAVTAHVTVLDPDRNLVLVDSNLPAYMAPGDRLQVSVALPALPSKLGIWHVAYELLDAGGNVIHEERECMDGRFVVADWHLSTISIPGFQYFLTQDKDSHELGETGEIRIIKVETERENYEGGEAVGFGVWIENRGNWPAALDLYVEAGPLNALEDGEPYYWFVEPVVLDGDTVMIFRDGFVLPMEAMEGPWEIRAELWDGDTVRSSGQVFFLREESSGSPGGP